MLKNNNMAVIDRMAGKNLKSSRRRSLSMILSVFLSSFLLFSIFTTGITWFQMERLRNIRLDGAEFDAILYGVTEEQMEACRKNPDIKRTGIAAVSGYIAKTVPPVCDTPGIGKKKLSRNTPEAPYEERIKDSLTMLYCFSEGYVNTPVSNAYTTHSGGTAEVLFYPRETTAWDNGDLEHLKFFASIINLLCAKAGLTKHANILSVGWGRKKEIAAVRLQCMSNEVLVGILGITVS